MSGANENEPVDPSTTVVEDDAAGAPTDEASATEDAPDSALESASEPDEPTEDSSPQSDADGEDGESSEDHWNDVRVRAAIEAMLFAADEPLPIKAIIESLPDAREETVRRALGQMMLELSGDARGIHLHEVAGGYQLRTNATYHEQVLLLFEAKPTKLSRAAMETLAIVAYRQPVTKAIVDEIRGVDCGGVLRGLTDLELIAVIGKADDIGRPNLYGTTQRFLEFFSLSSLTDLPTLEDFEVDALELLGEDVEHLLGERDDEDDDEGENNGDAGAVEHGEPRDPDPSDPGPIDTDPGNPDLSDQAPNDGDRAEQAQLPDFPHGRTAGEDNDDG